MKLYKIETEFSSEEEIVEKINLATRSEIDALESAALKHQHISVEYKTIENNHLVSYVFANWRGLKVLKSTINIAGIQNVRLKDVTEEVLIYGIEMPEDAPFYSIYKKFILKNLSVDAVLDNINKKGIEKLTKLEKSILECSNLH